MEKFAVISANANQKGGFVVKLVQSKMVDLGALGKKESKVTYYISVAEKPTAKEVELPMDKLRVQEYPFTTPEGETMNLKWLHLR